MEKFLPLKPVQLVVIVTPQWGEKINISLDPGKKINVHTVPKKINCEYGQQSPENQEQPRQSRDGQVQCLISGKQLSN